MIIHKHPKGRYLLLAPIVFLVLNALFFQHATKEIQNALLYQKYIEIVHATKVLSEAVEADPERPWQDYERSIRNSVEYLDGLYQVYAGAYKLVDGKLTLFSNRVYETSPFDPLDYEKLREKVFMQDSGYIIVEYLPDYQTNLELHVYFMWMPLHSAQNERYLIITGVSRNSVETTIALWISIGQWVSMGITYILLTWMIILLARFGQAGCQKEGDKLKRE